MKEVTYEDWQKNPTSRMMWVWDDIENSKQKRKVIYFHGTDMSYPIIALSDDETDTENFKHCAEIEEPETRRMTHKELSRWLRKKSTREFRYRSSCSVYSTHNYDEDDEEVEVPEDILIREDDGKWREPLVEVEE